MTTIRDIIMALSHGREIANPATWKNTQNTINIIASFLGIAVFVLRFCGVDLEISDNALLKIATGVATVLGALNGIITTASSAKVGIK